jgi:predicted ArsR family transcriptional regulator
MAEDITREELLEELRIAYSGLMPIQPDEFTAQEIAREIGIHVTTMLKHIDSGKVPEGWEVVERKGRNGQATKCLRKIRPT